MSYNNENPFFMPVQPAYGYGGGGGMFGGGWGQDWMWLIVLFLFGWNNGGWGGGMLGGGNMNGGVGSEVQRGFDHSSVIMKLDGLTTGLADLGFALTNTMTNGFHGVDTAVCNLGYQTQAGFNALAAQLAQCCCDNREAISGLRYDMATQACETRRAIQDSTRQISDLLTAQRIEAKDETIARQNQQIFQLELAASQSNQNSVNRSALDAAVAELLRRLAPPTPVPAYNVPNPYVGYGYGHGNCNPCGC